MSRNSGLDGIRGIAIALVMVHHGFFWCRSSSALSSIWLGFTNSLWIGVDLFFVLSGFLITGILLRSRDKPHYFRTFYMRRVFRIFPLYFVWLGCVTLLVFIAPPHQLGKLSLGWNLLYLANVNTALHGWSWPPFAGLWSLSVEEQFYLVWPTVILLIPRRAVAPALCLAAMAFPIARMAVHLRPEATYTMLHLDGLLIGSAFAATWRWLGQWKAARSVALFSFAGATLALALLAAGGIRGLSWRGYIGVPSLVYTLIAFWGVCLIALSLYSDPLNPLNRVLAASPLQMLGKYSYALYLIHEAVLHAMNPKAHWPPSQDLTSAILYLAVSAAIAIGLAWLSWKFLEGPCLRLKERLFPYSA